MSKYLQEVIPHSTFLMHMAVLIGYCGPEVGAGLGDGIREAGDNGHELFAGKVTFVVMVSEYTGIWYFTLYEELRHFEHSLMREEDRVLAHGYV